MRPQTRVVSGGDGEAQHLELGRPLQLVLGAGAVGAAAAILGIPLLTFRVNAGEEDVEKLSEKVARIERNQHEIDISQRLSRQRSIWNGDKLDALLDNAAIPRVPQPELPDSSLEQPAPASSPE